VGVVAHSGEFSEGDAVEIVDERGALIAKGLSRTDAERWELEGDLCVHRDDLVVLQSA
jgi:glutamate 5-kinase